MEEMDRIETNKNINDFIVCQNCPAKIFQKDTDKIKYGQGNLLADYIFILPIEAYKNKHANFYLETICWNLISFDNIYITYHPKCKASSPVEGYADTCKYHLFNEITKIKPKKLIFFGVDIPEEINAIQIQKFKLNNVLSIYYDYNKLFEIRNKLIEIL